MEQEKLDRLLYHGKIHTLKTEGDVVEALGIRAGKIVYDGPSKQVDQAVLDAIYGEDTASEAAV